MTNNEMLLLSEIEGKNFQKEYQEHKENPLKLGEKPVYRPTGRLATPKMLDFLAFKLLKRGIRAIRLK